VQYRTGLAAYRLRQFKVWANLLCLAARVVLTRAATTSVTGQEFHRRGKLLPIGDRRDQADDRHHDQELVGNTPRAQR
jgi:hypothetical protein